MGRRKGLKDIRTLRDVYQADRPQGPGRTSSYSPSIKSWVFSEEPEFKRFQPVTKKKIKAEKKEKVTVQKIKDPAVEVFNDVNKIRVVVSFPGPVKKEINIEVLGDIVAIEAEGIYQNQPVKYYKEVLLPFPVKEEILDSSFENHVLEIRLERKKKEALS